MQGLGNNERKCFLGIAQGKITYRPGRDAERQLFDFVEGTVKEILRRDATINGEPIKFYDFIIQNGSDTYALSVPINSGPARDIVLRLASIENFSGQTIRFSPWLKDTYTNVALYANGKKLDWGVDPKALPPINRVKVGRKEVIDDSERVDFIEGLVDTINTRLRQATYVPSAPVDYERVPEEGAAGPEAGPETPPPPTYEDGEFGGGSFPGWDQKDFHPNM